MKKYLVWIGAVVMVMAVASPLLAQTPMPPYTYGPGNIPNVPATSLWKSWGHMEIATYWINKPDFGQGGYSGYVSGSGVAPTVTQMGQDNTIRNITERFRFYLQYGDPKTVRGVIGFEADSQNWGESGWTSTDASVGTTTNPSGRIGVYRTDQVQLEVKHAFIEFVVPNTPVSVIAGLQGVNLGDTRTGYQNDAPGVTINADFAPHRVSAYWWRERDVDTLTYNTNDMYALRYMLFQKLFNVDVWGLYRNGLAGLAAVNGVVVDTRFVDHPYWIGANGGFRPGNWDFAGTFIYNGGKQEAKVPALSDRDYSGYLVNLMATYRIGPGLAATLEAFYASGNDADDPNKIKAYQYPAGSEAVWALGNSRSVFFLYNLDFMYYNMKYLYATGMYYGRANIEYNPLPWVNLNFNYMYFGDTGKGTPGPGKAVNSPTGAQQSKDEDYIGSELNVIARLKIYENLYYNIGLGYFIPGAVYDHYTAAGAKDRSPDNAWSFLTCLRMAF
jgi:hypothetical protein